MFKDPCYKVCFTVCVPLLSLGSLTLRHDMLGGHDNLDLILVLLILVIGDCVKFCVFFSNSSCVFALAVDYDYLLGSQAEDNAALHCSEEHTFDERVEKVDSYTPFQDKVDRIMPVEYFCLFR